MENALTPEKFLRLHLFKEKKYSEIAKEYNIQIKTLSQFWTDSTELRVRINKAKKIYNNKKGKKEGVGLLDPETFFNWYDPREKNCCYCGIEEQKLEKIFDAGILSSKRKRGRTLELERLDSTDNLYNYDNCDLACYFCNSHKSDIISETDYKKYFSSAIREYLEAKYTEALNK